MSFESGSTLKEPASTQIKLSSLLQNHIGNIGTVLILRPASLQAHDIILLCKNIFVTVHIMLNVLVKFINKLTGPTDVVLS